MKKLFFVALAGLAGVVINLPLSASGEVRFGRSVRIGEHDVSNQTFNRKPASDLVTPVRDGMILACLSCHASLVPLVSYMRR